MLVDWSEKSIIIIFSLEISIYKHKLTRCEEVTLRYWVVASKEWIHAWFHAFCPVIKIYKEDKTVIILLLFRYSNNIVLSAH